MQTALVAAGYHVGELGRTGTRLYSVPWKDQALPSPDAMEDDFQGASTFEILTLKAFSLSVSSVTSSCSNTMFLLGLQMSSTTICRKCTQAKMHATVTDAYFQIKRQFQSPNAVEHVCQIQK